jgi:hypothetical protein
MMGAGFRLYRGYLSEKALQADFAYLLAQDAEANVGRRSDLDKHREHQRTGAEQA